MAGDIYGGSLAVAGLRVQHGRIRVLSENIANARSTPATPGGDPYRRKIAVYQPIKDTDETQPPLQILRDKTDFPTVHDPGHSGADSTGRLKLPNVTLQVEMADLRSAMRAYESNMGVISKGDELRRKTIDLLKG